VHPGGLAGGLPVSDTYGRIKTSPRGGVALLAEVSPAGACAADEAERFERLEEQPRSAIAPDAAQFDS
jgi:hypothetical protein